MRQAREVVLGTLGVIYNPSRTQYFVDDVTRAAKAKGIAVNTVTAASDGDVTVAPRAASRIRTARSQVGRVTCPVTRSVYHHAMGYNPGREGGMARASNTSISPRAKLPSNSS